MKECSIYKMYSFDFFFGEFLRVLRFTTIEFVCISIQGEREELCCILLSTYPLNKPWTIHHLTILDNLAFRAHLTRAQWINQPGETSLLRVLCLTDQLTWSTIMCEHSGLSCIENIKYFV